jgi:hypothetical protein
VIFEKTPNPFSFAEKVARLSGFSIRADVRVDVFLQALEIDFNLVVAFRGFPATWPEALRRKKVETVVDVEMVLPKVGRVYREDQSVPAHCTLIHTCVPCL